jgi:DNA-binding MarR family transcriptional regulator
MDELSSNASITQSELPNQISTAELGEIFVAAWHAFTEHGHLRFNQHGLSAERVRMLVTVGHNSPLRMGGLAEQLGVTGRTVTALVDASEAEGVLTRRPDPYDRRAFRLTLTEEGERLLQKIEKLQQEVTGEIFASLDSAERGKLAELLLRITHSPKPHTDSVSIR